MYSRAMKIWLFALVLVGIGFAQEAPSFVEVGERYQVQGDIAINMLLEEQDYIVEVLEVADGWIKVHSRMLEGDVWLNLDRVMALANVRDIPMLREGQIGSCLREVATQQEIHFIDYDAYTDVGSLHEVYDSPQACSMVTLEDDGSNAETYSIIGRIEDTAFRVTPQVGVEPLD